MHRALSFENFWQFAREHKHLAHQEEELQRRERAVAAREAGVRDLPWRANSHNGAAAAHRGQVHSIFAPGTESETEIYGRAGLSRTGSGTDSFGSGAVGSQKSLKSMLSEFPHSSVQAQFLKTSTLC